MLLIYQSGEVRVGDVVRYTLTYTPSDDCILPTPSHLYVRIRNVSAVALRAAYLHGPYTFYAACYPTTFDPNSKDEHAQDHGVPEYEPTVKAGGIWDAKLTIPEGIRLTSDTVDEHRGDTMPKSFSWRIEISSQVIFSTNAAVHYEVLVGRDERSVEIGLSQFTGDTQRSPGVLGEDVLGKPLDYHHRGIFSRAVSLVVEDTATLWNKPPFPVWNDDISETSNVRNRLSLSSLRGRQSHHESPKQLRKRKKVHLVILTHGLHSNLGADMLYLKESIDAAARQARVDARKHRQQLAAQTQRQSQENARDAHSDLGDLDEDEDEEQVIVRGFSGNACRTEKGIQYLGKRLAKYVLMTTYPDQPYYPVKTSAKKHVSQPIHHHNHVSKESRAYEITSISFIAHSLGGLIQTYAIAYIQKHSPQFFEKIKPVNFVAMATPFLGLSNENPVYVKFALDLGLIKQTGRDLGLSWRGGAVRSGIGAMIAGLGDDSKKSNQQDPGSKPLLRILPSGPAHTVLKMFRNRTVYSNVVNDGVVPLRTSCLLFLDWKGLGRVEKARRENGMIGTVIEWGISELLGTNTTAAQKLKLESPAKSTDSIEEADDQSKQVPQPDENAARDDNLSQANMQTQAAEIPRQPSPLSQLFSFSFFKPSAEAPKSPRQLSIKQSKVYKRSQTLNFDNSSPAESVPTSPSPDRPSLVRGDSLYQDNQEEPFSAPPKTTFFESAGDLLAPPLPPPSFLIDPDSRPRTIFHDRIYNPEDIPSPTPKRQHTIHSFAHSSSTPTISLPPSRSGSQPQSAPASSMKVEEKIARAYHHDLSWRKVLVRLEPDAHNNMIVRRMFSNAYGWPVVKHMVDTHFGYACAEAKDVDVGEEGRVNEHPKPARNETTQPVLHLQEPTNEDVEARDVITDLPTTQSVDVSVASTSTSSSEFNLPIQVSLSRESRPSTSNSARWTDRFFDTEDEDDDEFLETPVSPTSSHVRAGDGAGEEGSVITSSDRLTRSPVSMRSSQKGSKGSRTFSGVALESSVGLGYGIDNAGSGLGTRSLKGRGIVEQVNRFAMASDSKWKEGKSGKKVY